MIDRLVTALCATNYELIDSERSESSSVDVGVGIGMHCWVYVIEEVLINQL